MSSFDEPEEPTQDDCCQNGCNPCVFDIYKSQLEAWERNQKSNITVRYDLLSQTRFKPFFLKNITPLTADTSLYRLQPAVDDLILSGVLPYKSGQHLVLRVDCENENVDKVTMRDYTIITRKYHEENCCFEVLIKLYRDGAASKFIENLKQGDISYWRGPYGNFLYEPNKYRNILMICMGTGIAPMYALIQEIIYNDNDETVIKLMYGCRNASNIILREELEKLSSYWNFSYSCFLSESFCKEEKKYSENFISGKISSDYIRVHLSKMSSESVQVLICGSELFSGEVANALHGNGVTKEKIHVF